MVPLVAVDQVKNVVDAHIRCSLSSPDGGLGEGQLTQHVTHTCTNLTFTIFSPRDGEELILYADGPCKDAAPSKKTVKIQFLPCTCPIGFQISVNKNTSCECLYSDKLSEYVNCISNSEYFLRMTKVWISYVEKAGVSDYMIYPHCPLDYCHSASSSLNVPVNLNQHNGADVQCAFNRTGLLCGACQPGLSLSLSSSRCLSCPTYWPVLLIGITVAAILAGIGLVALLLVLNLTVAVGTLNALIFYANIVAANSSIFLPFSKPNFVTVFISWLNLELGIDTCYFHGMDAYTKTWLQLAFPIYLLFLVTLVIIISHYSSSFANLIASKNPVATLATLILFSYTKLLQICVAALS